MGSTPGNKTEEFPLCVLGSQEWHRRMGREEWERPVLESWAQSAIIGSGPQGEYAPVMKAPCQAHARAQETWGAVRGRTRDCRW